MYANPSKAHLRALLRHVVSHPDEAAAKGTAARAAMLRRFSPEVRTVLGCASLPACCGRGRPVCSRGTEQHGLMRTQVMGRELQGHLRRIAAVLESRDADKAEL